MQSSSFTNSVNMNFLSVSKDLTTDHAKFGGEIDLDSAKIGGNLSMDSSSLAESISADSISVGKDFIADNGKFDSNMDLDSAKIGGNISMDTSSFAKDISADSLKVEKDLSMSDRAHFGGDIDLDSAKVGGDLSMNSHATFEGKIQLHGATIGGTLDLSSSSFSKAVTADRSSVAGSLFMRGQATFNGAIGLRAVKVGSNLELTGSSFAETLDGTRLTVGGNLLMNGGANFRDKVFLIDAKVADSIELREATLVRLDLSGADARELLVNGSGWWCAGGELPAGLKVSQKADTQIRPVYWRLGDSSWRSARCDTTPATLPTLILRNAHVETFQDSPDAWPPSMDLEGFHYERLGGSGVSGRDDLRQRPSSDWSDWLERDRTFSTQPYTQLSSVLLAAGRRSASEAIQLAGRERERNEAWAHSFWSWLWLTAFSVVAGYGIGLHTFRVLWWVLVFTLLGAAVLHYSPIARRRSLAWRLGASLHRLLPLVELSKEFKDFFENPPDEDGEPRNLNRFLAAYFAGQALAGWILGSFLLAAMGALTQKG
jgi:hypothetical protein